MGGWMVIVAVLALAVALWLTLQILKRSKDPLLISLIAAAALCGAFGYSTLTLFILPSGLLFAVILTRAYSRNINTQQNI